MQRRLIISFITVIFAALYLTAQTSVEVSLPRNPGVGDRFSLTVSVNNADGNVSGLEAPSLTGCTFLGGPMVGNSSYTSIINGRVQSSETVSYTFTYRADKEGTVKVGAIGLSVGGKQYSTQPGQFTILASRQGSTPQSGGGRNQAPQGGGSASSDFNVSADQLFIRMQLTSSTVYEQQATECIVKLYSLDGRINSINALSTPNFDGCLIETLPLPQTVEWKSEVVNGKTYYVGTIYSAILYPQRSGDITLTMPEYNVGVYREVVVRDFFMPRSYQQEKEVTLKPSGATLHVKALPTPQPADFSGAVGKFTASTRLVGNTFKTNEAASMIYTIEGTGNIKFLTAPTIDFPSEFEVFDPHVDTKAYVSGPNMKGTQTIEYTFVPQSVGKFRIGAHNFVYFNPATAQYETVPIEGYEIDVAKGAEVSSNMVSGKQDVKSKNTDIHHIKAGADKPTAKTSLLACSKLYWWAYPILILLAVGGFYYFRKRSTADVSVKRLNKAGKVARRRLSTAGKLLRAKNYEPYYAELLRAIQSYVSDKLQIPASQLNRENIVSTLEARGASAEMCKSLTDILNECEMARYTPNLTSENADRVFDAARNLINDIERLK